MFGGVDAFASFTEAATVFGVFFWVEREVRIFLVFHDVFMDGFDEGDAPSTTCACGEAFGDEGGDLWSFAFAIVHNLAL